MKKRNIILAFLVLITTAFAACEKDDPAGVPEFDNYFYAGFLPWNNTGLESVPRTQTTLVKFPVKFNSTTERDFDAVAQYTLVSTGITNPAVAGQDFNIVDRTGNTLQPSNGAYSLSFPRAKEKVDTIYVRVLNSTVAGTRRIQINLIKNTTPQYTVGTFTQSFIRFLEVK
jgi:hypothetical protein